MTDSTSPSPAPSTVTVLAATIGQRHGYTIEGDSVRLHADLVVYDSAVAATKDWALQLWACNNPFSGGPLTGHLVAETELGNLEEFTAALATFHATTSFLPPAGGGDFPMTLALVAGRDGRLNEIHSYANYRHPETFLIPRLQGKVGYRIENTRVIVEIESIENPRPSDTVSGTLSLELWALSSPYSGGHFSGAPLAGAVLGTLAGRTEWNPTPLDLVFKSPPDGTWFFCLMLREWNGTAYTTRDYSNFAQTVLYKAPPVVANAPEPSRAPFTAAPTANLPAALTPAAARRAAPEKSPATAPSKSPAAPRAKSPATVSVNSAPAADLTAVKGLSKPTVAALIAARPFASLDDLLKVKGFGPKLLAKLKPALKL